MRWSPRIRQRVFGNRLLGLVINGSRSGVSFTLNLFGFSVNSRGTWSFNGPSVLDFRGTWRERQSRRQP